MDEFPAQKNKPKVLLMEGETLKKQLLMAAMMPALLVGCSQDDKPSKPSGNTVAENLSRIFSRSTQELISIQSLEGQPIANAQILIGDKLGSPFQNNFLITDSNGQVAVPSEWVRSESVTVEAPGFLRSTFLSQEPGSLKLSLRPLPSATRFEVAGLTKDHSVVDKDGLIDFGLVLPALSKTDLLAFDMDTMISPEEDTISAAGQEVKVPSNITLPKQRESYGIFPVTLEKPNFRVYFGQGGVQRVLAIRGQFPFSEVIGKLRNGSKFPELINDFAIHGGGLRDIEIVGQKSRVDIPLKELNFTAKKNVLAPLIAKDEVFMAVGVSEISGYMIPTDVKRIAAGKKMDLSTLPSAQPYVLGVVKKSNEMESGKPGADRLSATILPFATGTSPQMLPLLPNPSLNGPAILQIPRINTITGVHPIATYSILSKIHEKMVNGKTEKTLERVWEIYGGGWQDRLVLPEWPQDTKLAGKKRWEVTLVGSQTSSHSIAGPAMIEHATHVTHSSLDY